jgi:hypothetical protein
MDRGGMRGGNDFRGGDRGRGMGRGVRIDAPAYEQTNNVFDAAEDHADNNNNMQQNDY